MKKETKIIVVTGVVAALTGLVVYMVVKKGKTPGPLGAAYDSFASIFAGSKINAGTSDCEAQCTADPACLAYSVNKTTGQCVVTKQDPYTAAVDDDAWTLYVKRDTNANPSSWSIWSPEECPGTGGASCVKPGTTLPKEQTRTCSGKCPGKATRSCPSVAYCDVFEELPMGFTPVGEPKWVRKDADTTVDACEMECLKDPKCTGYMFDTSFKTCDCIGNSEPLNIFSEDTRHTTASRVHVRMPGDGNGTWGPMVHKTECKCGEATHARTCSSGTDCKIGAAFVSCPNAPCSSYDPFEGLRA